MNELMRKESSPLQVTAKQIDVAAPAQDGEYFDFRGMRWYVRSISVTLHQHREWPHPRHAEMQIECISG